MTGHDGGSTTLGEPTTNSANVRTAEAARQSLQSGLTIAFKSGAITGLLVAGLALLSITFYYVILINLNIDNRILFVGGIDRKDSTKYYDIADAFILCNRTWNNKIEGLPNVVLEAMGRSKPVIGSKNSGTEELIIDGKTGYIVDPENIQDIKEIIISASENRNQLKVMGDNALNFIQKNFSNKKMEEEYIRILNEN